MRGSGFAKLFLRFSSVLKREDRTMQLELRKGNAQFGDTVLWRKLERLLEITDRLLRFLHVVEHISTIDIRLDHLRIDANGTGVVVLGLIEQAALLVHIPRQQREVWLFGQDILVAISQIEYVVVALHVIEVVAEIHGH